MDQQISFSGHLVAVDDSRIPIHFHVPAPALTFEELLAVPTNQEMIRQMLLRSTPTRRGPRIPSLFHDMGRKMRAILTKKIA